MTTHTFFATTPKGMADLLAAEILGLGGSDLRENRAGVEFSGELEVAYRVCLWSRVANRVLLPLAKFAAPSPEALYASVRAIDWQAHLDSAQTLAVDANVASSNMTHSQYVALKTKDAIVDSFTDQGLPRPSVDIHRPDLRINCYVHRNQAEIYLDLSGASLHQRNYRSGTGQAPLKENLAAAILMRARWQEVAAEGGAFVDLMCGSGTLVIEAALMAADIAPALQRDYFGFLGWRGHQPAIWQRLLAEAHYRREQGLAQLPPLMGFDSNRHVLQLAKDNASSAGIGQHVEFAYQDVFNLRHDFPATGLMVTNPPYGKRLNQLEQLQPLYKALGHVLRHQFTNWRAAIFVEDQQLGKYVGIKASRLHTLYNGALACKLIHFNITADQFFKDARLPRPLNPDEISDSGLGFRNRLTKNVKQISKWAKRETVHAYRVYDQDLPDYAAAIDLYWNANNSEERWVNIQEYQAPSTIDPQKSQFRLRELVTITKAFFDLDDDHLFFRTRTRQRGDAQYERFDGAAKFHEILEGSVKLLVNFEDYLDTGLFLDHRPIRQRIAREAVGKDFLNLFAYTGTATVHAAKGGAASTTSVDMSRTYLDWAQRNLQKNGFFGSRHSLVQENCLTWLERQKGGQYDLIFLDPPSFSNSKRMQEAFDIQRDHEALIQAALKLLRKNGTLYFSTNLRKFKLDTRLSQTATVTNISAETIPFDFKRRQNIHHTFKFQASNSSKSAS